MAETSTIFGFMKYVSATDILSDFKKTVDSHFVNSLRRDSDKTESLLFFLLFTIQKFFCYNQFKGVTITMNTNLNRILFIFSGICFIFTYFLTKNFTYLPLGLCCLILSTNKKREDH